MLVWVGLVQFSVVLSALLDSALCQTLSRGLRETPLSYQRCIYTFIWSY